jgi:hypothetical protein
MLAYKHADTDHGSDEISTSEALRPRCFLSSGSVLLGNGGLDSGKLGFDVNVGSVQLDQRLLCLVKLAPSSQIPRCLGGEWQANAKDEDEEELCAEGSTPCPAIRPLTECLDDGVGNELTDGDAQVHTGCRDTSENHGCDLGGCERGDGEVEAESTTEDELGDEEGRVGGGKDLSKDAASSKNKADGQGPLAADAVAEIGAEESAEEATDAGDEVEG